ncbi:ketopantoate reductase PanE/ApbA-domain-containing protein [Pyrenochaeta sp. MPI-SDFR-AT-0127]|nr:ketopantoate reductase PanE/ApbA-domain-containing protein [Pyrenochaeta sp. MPI-SDFR-AT-0127]
MVISLGNPGGQRSPGPRVLLYGAGSIGGVYVYQLLQAGCEVTAVCRSNYSTVKAHGFNLKSLRYGNVCYRPTHVVRDLTECANQCFDYVLVCTKALPDSKPSLAQQIEPVLQGRPRTVIILAQNGIMIEEDVAVAFPQNPVLSGVVYCPAVQTGPGTIVYPEMLNCLELGTYPATAPSSHKMAAKKFVDLMINGGGGAELHENIQIARWSKLLMNAAWNPIGALTLTTDGDFLLTSDPYAHESILGIMKEIVELAEVMGVPGVSMEVAEKKFSIARKRAETGTGREMSMLQDVRQGRPFEVEAIVGNAVRLGREKSVSMPRLETLYALAKGRCWALMQEQTRKPS